MTTTAQPDLVAVKRRQQAAWAAGDYGVIGATLNLVGELLCEAADLRSTQRVLDVATGNGNAALAAARRWCEVTAIDYVPALLDEGRARAAGERLEIMFTEGDAEAIPFPDAAFDVDTLMRTIRADVDANLAGAKPEEVILGMQELQTAIPPDLWQEYFSDLKLYSIALPLVRR